MSVYVLDASVAVKWFLEEEHSEAALRLLDARHHLHAPDFSLLELDHVLAKRMRRGELETSEAWEIRQAIRTLPVLRHRFELFSELAFELAAASGRGIYDCVYLALALVLGVEVVTADRRFYDALVPGPLADALLWVEDVPAL